MQRRGRQVDPAMAAPRPPLLRIHCCLPLSHLCGRFDLMNLGIGIILGALPPLLPPLLALHIPRTDAMYALMPDDSSSCDQALASLS